MNAAQPPSDERAEQTGVPPQLRTGPILGGAVLGFLASWLLAFAMAIGLLAAYGYDDTGVWQYVAFFGALALPAIISVALLVPTRTRHWGAGLLVGLAIGSVLGAGVCVGNGALGIWPRLTQLSATQRSQPSR